MLSRTLLLTVTFGLNMSCFQRVRAQSSTPNTCDASASIGTAKDKWSDLWSKIMDTSYDPTNDPIPAADLAVANPFQTKKVFTDCGDTMQNNRKKSIHKRGLVFGAKYIAIPNSFGYSGIFDKGSSFAIARFSYAVPPEIDDDGVISVLPGFAMKFLLDHRPSVNLFAMHSLDPQNTFNLFTNNVSNSLPELTSISLKFGAQSFRIAKYLAQDKLFVSPKDTDPLFLTLDPLAKALNEGKKDSVAPHSIICVPSEDIKNVYKTAGFDIDNTDFRVVMNAKGKDSKVFDVYAEKVDQSSKIGEIYAISDFVASTFGDQDLFFQHPL